ncbi:MAG: ATP-binding protein [Bacilli bacterium]|nr:ATP-binding protein [Bacilli bacterium]
MKASYRKDLSNARYVKVPGFTPHTNGDTSAVCDYANDGSFNVPLDIAEGSVTDFRLFWKWLGENIFLSIVRLFDDSVESLSPVDKQGNAMNSFWFQRIGEEAPTMVDALTLEKLLSKGTVRGITLYALSIITFRVGGHLLVDEIESSFNRNLIENLMLMYDDKSINKQGGSIIYSTHYAELLDIHSRCDNVNVLHREGAKITLKNMSADYGVRTEMLKSAQFNQNTFDTLINYNRLMDLKEAVRKG